MTKQEQANQDEWHAVMAERNASLLEVFRQATDLLLIMREKVWKLPNDPA